MLYIYVSSVLLYLEMCNPSKKLITLVLGIYHSINIGLGVGFVWLIFFFIGNYIQKTAKSIKYENSDETLKISYNSFYWVNIS